MFKIVIFSEGADYGISDRSDITTQLNTLKNAVNHGF